MLATAVRAMATAAQEMATEDGQSSVASRGAPRAGAPLQHPPALRRYLDTVAQLGQQDPMHGEFLAMRGP